MTQKSADRSPGIDAWDHPFVQALDMWVSLNGAVLEAASRAGMALMNQSTAMAHAFAPNDPSMPTELPPEKEASPNETDEHGCCENCPSPGSCSRITAASFAIDPVTE